MSGEPTPTHASRQSKEAEVMSTCNSIADFKVLSALNNESAFGVVVLATCTKPDHPFPWKVYALKAIKNFGADSSRKLKAKYESEFNTFRRIPHHNRLVKCWTAFIDGIPDDVLSAFTVADQLEAAVLTNAVGSPVSRSTARTMYFVFDYHPETLLSYRVSVTVPVLPWSDFSPIGEQVLEGELFFERVGLAHRDIKPDNVMRKADGCVCFIDLGEALIVPTGSDGKPNWRVTIPSTSTGGNPAHTAPEVLNALRAFNNNMTVSTVVDYSGQGVFETGVLLWELATGQHPFGDYPLSVTVMGGSGSVVRYDDGVVWESVSTALSPALLGAGYPVEFLPLIRRMTACNPADRLSLKEAAKEFEAMLKPSEQAPVPSCGGCASWLAERNQLQSMIARLEAEKLRVKEEGGAVIDVKANHTQHQHKKVNEIEGMHVRTIPIVPVRCWGMAVNSSESLIAVTSVDFNNNGNKLYLHSLPGGELLRTIGELGDGPGQFRWPRRVCFGPDDVIIVADYFNNRLQEFTSTGEYKRGIAVGEPLSVCVSNENRLIGVGTFGSVVLLDYDCGDVFRTITGQLNRWVTGLRFTPDGKHMLASDIDGRNVKMLSVVDGSFLRSVCEGVGYGGNKDLCFAANGDIVVADGGNHRIRVFTPDGSTEKREFGREGTGDGQFKHPTAVSVVNGRLYVLDINSSRVQVFK